MSLEWFAVMPVGHEAWEVDPECPPFTRPVVAPNTRVSLGKAAHRCDGWLPCATRCVLVGPWIVEPARLVRGGWFKNERGEWTR